MLDPQAMHELEKEALEDEFLAEALEGYHSIKTSHANLSLLQQQLQTRIAKHRVEKTSVSLSARRLSVAAVVGLILILSGILFWMIVFDGDTISRRSANPGIQTQEFAVFEASGNAQPTLGWEEYNRYMENNLRATDNSKTGKVVLQFTVGGNKQVQAIQVIEGLTAAQNEEAIRLIKEGPQWTTSGDTKPANVRVTINFKQ